MLHGSRTVFLAENLCAGSGFHVPPVSNALNPSSSGSSSKYSREKPRVTVKKRLSTGVPSFSSTICPE